MPVNMDLVRKEHGMLREELNKIKQAQLWFINFSVGSTGVMGALFSMGSPGDSAVPAGIVNLIPLIILLPSWHLFFDKAITLTRIVGYLKVLEKIIIRPELVKNFTGWENALVIFRARQELAQRRETAHSFAEERKLFFRLQRTSERYWGTCYLIFFVLSWLCVISSIYHTFKIAGSGSGHLFLFSLLSIAVVTALLGYSSWRNFRYFCFLGWGRYSYLVNEFLWKQIILSKMILEHERLIEYADERDDPSRGCPWRSKALNFERRELNFLDYNTLSVRIAPVQRAGIGVKIQLIDRLEFSGKGGEDSTDGLDLEKYLLSDSDSTTIKIPLKTFADAHIDLKKIYRLSIHHGKYAFGERINSSNDIKINVEEIALE